VIKRLSNLWALAGQDLRRIDPNPKRERGSSISIRTSPFPSREVFEVLPTGPGGGESLDQDAPGFTPAGRVAFNLGWPTLIRKSDGDGQNLR